MYILFGPATLLLHTNMLSYTERYSLHHCMKQLRVGNDSRVHPERNSKYFTSDVQGIAQKHIQGPSLSPSCGFTTLESFTSTVWMGKDCGRWHEIFYDQPGNDFHHPCPHSTGKNLVTWSNLSAKGAEFFLHTQERNEMLIWK